MKAVAEIQVQPVGTGVSTRDEIQQAVSVLRDSGLEARVHALGTDVEGELVDVLRAVQRIHETLHENGAPRLATTVTIHTRIDKTPGLERAERAIAGRLIEKP